jgi:hypothetical protein
MTSEPSLPDAAPACPNCGSPLGGPYCSACGQRQTDLERPFGELAAEAVSGFIAFDERLLTTLKLLITRPGELTLEFARGRRASYAHPLRLYFAISVLLFSMLGISGFTVIRVGGRGDTVITAVEVSASGRSSGPGTASQLTGPDAGERPKAGAVDSGPAPTTTAPASPSTQEQKGLLTRLLLRLAEVYEHDPARLNKAFTNRLASSVIVLVPAFALLLRPLYRRTRYVTHLVFSLHLHSFAFLVLLVGITLDLLLGHGQASGGLATGLAQLAIAVYAFLALRRVHRQGRLLTIVKMVALLIGYLVPLLVTMLATVVVTVALV